jgi:moderate conductance mechanosensitive channel
MLAGAGIAGIAIGFGAQNLVRDVLAGLFVVLEDQYGVGDTIDAGSAVGTVEDFNLRVTKLRDVEGTLWFIPNGTIAEVGNKTQMWARAILDIEIGYSVDHKEAGRVIKATADRLWREQRPGERIIEEPELWGVERLGESSVAIRLAVKSAPAEQWKVARTLRGEIKDALDDAGFEIPFPQRTIWVRSDPAALPARGDGRTAAPADEAEQG